MQPTPEQAMGIAQFLIPQIEDECKTTRRLLAAVPSDKGDYKPHDKCMSAIELASHIATTDVWFLDGIVKESFSGEDSGPKLKNTDEVLAYYDKGIPAAIQKLKGLTGEQLAKPVQFFHMTLPNIFYLQFMIKHSVHHRGQLSAYLRPIGAKVPSIYGGSADEPFDVAAAQQA
jgi:uncharacterized damage-inducible protein DinB